MGKRPGDGVAGVFEQFLSLSNQGEFAFNETAGVRSPARDGLLGEFVDAGVVSDPAFAQVPVCRGEDEVSVGR